MDANSVSIPARMEFEDRDDFLAGVANRLRAARTKAGMTQDAAAEAIGIGERTIAGWESGIRAPGAETLARTARVYGVTPDYLLGFDVREEGKALVDVQRIQEIEDVIASGDKERAKALLRSEKRALFIVATVIPPGADLRPVVEVERSIQELHYRFIEAFPAISRQWASQHLGGV